MARVVPLVLIFVFLLVTTQTACAPAAPPREEPTSAAEPTVPAQEHSPVPGASATALPSPTAVPSAEETAAPDLTPVLPLQVSSEAFEQGAEIPSRHALCPDRTNLSPALSWSNVPAAAESLALICVDTDVDFVHWVIYNIPPSVTGLPEGLANIETLEGGMLQGTNSFGELGYGGPCPPAGQTHTYVFTLYALDAVLDVPAGASAESLRQAMEGHILARAGLAGLYAGG